MVEIKMQRVGTGKRNAVTEQKVVKVSVKVMQMAGPGGEGGGQGRDRGK